MVEQRHSDYWSLLTIEGLEHHLTELENSPLPSTSEEAAKENQILDAMSENLDKKVTEVRAQTFPDTKKGIDEHFRRWNEIHDLSGRIWNRRQAHNDYRYHSDWKLTPASQEELEFKPMVTEEAKHQPETAQEPLILNVRRFVPKASRPQRQRQPRKQQRRNPRQKM